MPQVDIITYLPIIFSFLFLFSLGIIFFNKNIIPNLISTKKLFNAYIEKTEIFTVVYLILQNSFFNRKKKW
jgi:hypothetical protein